MKKIFIETVLSLCLGLGLLSFIVPILYFFWISGNQERYLWIISGPEPFNLFGSGPFILTTLLGFTFIGIIFIVLSIFGKKYWK